MSKNRTDPREPVEVLPMQLVVNLPTSAFSALRLSPEQYVDEMRRAAAVKWYELRRISQGKAAELCGVSRAQFVRILRDYRVSVLQDDPESLAAELAG
jgi:predicted HTH domain antitoxin